MRRFTIHILILFISARTYAQLKVYFHEYIPTESGWDVVAWNVRDTTGKEYLIKETVDSLDRVTELQFLQNGKLIQDHLCYLPNRVTYAYIQKTIIECLYSGVNPLMGNPCENYHTSIYYMDSQNFISQIEKHALLDFAETDSIEIESFQSSFKADTIIYPNPSQSLEVEYYCHSYHKCNNRYPVSRNYDIRDKHFYGNEPETKAIRISLYKTKK